MIEEFENIFNLSPDMIGIGTLDGYFTKINQSFEEILGYTEADFLSQSFLSFVHDDDIKATEKALLDANSGHKKIDIINRFHCKDGSYKWIHWIVRSSTEEGKFYAIGRDTSERKLAEDKLKESEEKFRMIFDHAMDGILIADAETKIFLDGNTKYVKC